MKTILLLVASLLVATNWGVGEEEPDLDDPKVREKILKEAVLREKLEERGPDGNELWYQSGSQTPYTGFVEAFHENGQVAMLGCFNGGKVRELCHYKDRKLDGPWIWYYKNGQKGWEGRFRDGKREGLWTGWYKNGQKRWEGRYKDGKKEGLWTNWHVEGKVVGQTRYKDGVEVKE